MAVVAGFDGYCRRSAWCPVQVLLANEGPDIEGELHIVESYASSSNRPAGARAVSLPSHSRKAYFLYLPSLRWSSRWKLRLIAGGDVLAEQEFSLRAVVEADRLYAVVGRGRENLNFLADVAPPARRGYVAYVLPENLPPDPLGWEGVDVVVLDDVDTSALSLEQRWAMEAWVAHGGHLIVSGGGGAAQTAAGIADLLPVTVGAVRSVDSLEALSLRLGGQLAPGPYAVAESVLRDGEVLLEQDGLPLVARRIYGAGTVDFLAFGTGADLFVRWEEATRLWSFLLDTAASSDVRLSFGEGYAAWTAVNSIPDLVAPSVLHLLAFMMVYTVLIGPVNYLVLKKLDRRELAWITILLLVGVFTAFAYGTGLQIRGRTPIVHRLTAVRVPAGTDVGRVTTAVGLFSPRRTTYDLRVDGAMACETEWDFYILPGYAPYAASPLYVLQEAEGSRVVGIQVDIGGIRPFIAEGYTGVSSVDASLQMESISEGGFRLEGTIRNGAVRLTDAVLLVGSEEQRLGDLEPGAEVAVRLDLYSSAMVSPGSAPLFGVPYGLNTLPGRVLGTEDYWNDAELYRKAQFLMALFPYGDAGLGPGVHLVGWGEEAPPTVEVVDRPSRQRVTALYIYDLPVTVHETSVGFTVPPSFISCVPEDEEAWKSLSLDPHQSRLFSCMPWTPMRMTQVEEMAIRFEGDGLPTISVWDWEKEEWVEVGRSPGWQTVPRPDAVVSPAGLVRVKVQADATPTFIGNLSIRMKGQR